MQTSRRQFLSHSVSAATASLLWPGLKLVSVGGSGPSLKFPSDPRGRISVASYPFRDFIAGSPDQSPNSSAPKMDFTDFAAHIAAKFNIHRIEPWSAHFRSLDEKYLDQFRGALEKAGSSIVDIAVDGEESPYAADRTQRDAAIAFRKKWIDAAALLGSPSIRTNIPSAKDSEPDVDRAADSFRRLADHASAKNVIINLENDNPVSEDPFFLVQLIDKVNSPWLHALPDFCNTLAGTHPDHGYTGIDAMFARAYNICHVKALELNRAGQPVHVDMEKTFGILKAHNYHGYCSMEFDSPGDPYKGTADLIETTLHLLQ